MLFIPSSQSQGYKIQKITANHQGSSEGDNYSMAVLRTTWVSKC